MGRSGLVAFNGLVENLGDNLVGRLARDELVTVGAVRLAHRGPEQAEIVVNFSDGANSGTGGARRCLLLDGDSGAEAVDGVNVGALHLVEELAGVGGEGFDVAALALGIDRVEGEGAFAGARQAGDHGERVARDRDGDVAKIVLAGAADVDVRKTHRLNGALEGHL